ncbi:hypothetical protein QP970_05150, partial [Corynebacterium sp. MSK073]|uniref:hypothetical protein n=1 Tax=Corynebacterium sp. MSK073 TaxID=3050198 RepID=UPI00254A0E16
HVLAPDTITLHALSKGRNTTQTDLTFRVFRHQENLPFVGWKDGGIFYVLWIETKYGDLYSH